MRNGLSLICLLISLSIHINLDAQDSVDLFNSSLEELLEMEVGPEVKKEADGLHFYGFVAPLAAEQVYNFPTIAESGSTVKNSEPLDFADPEGHFYIKARYGAFEGKVDLFGSTEDARVEAATLSYEFGENRQYSIQAGKMFRKFDLYNETLNHFIVFMGIEAPELFDGDHTIPRFANLAFRMEMGKWAWYVDTGNSESGAEKDLVPLGWDLRYDYGGLVFGTSGYTSSISGNRTKPSVDLGSGSPEGGVLPWMESDRYTIFGGFVRKEFDRMILESAFWNASHSGNRNPQGVLTLLGNTYLNPRQRENFFGDNHTLPDSELNASHVQTEADYDVKTAYLRFGYSFKKTVLYAHWDWMDHPEIIGEKQWGGDNEAGLSDTGSFTKWSLGAVWRPKKNLAVKCDVSAHVQKFNGDQVMYPEARLQGAWAFKFSPGKETFQ